MKKITKKTALFFLSLICLILLAIPVWASTNINTNKVEISFKVGDATLKINGQDVQVEKPFVTNGVTLVPLRVITEAFGAKVDWNGQEQSVTLNYNDKIIKLFINKKQVTVDGKETVLLEAPQINNNITMIPLRFVTENFGAQVSYDDKTAEIKVVKETGKTSVTDYEALLKKTTKAKIGDSFYGWSMNYPKDLQISERRFDGAITKLFADDETYGLSVVIWEKEGDTLETLLAEELEMKNDLTLITQGIEEKAGVKYAKTVFKAKGVLDTRFFIKDNKVFMIMLFAEDYDKYKDTTIYTSILDSFTLSFVKDDSIEDLSNINTEGYRTYEDKDLKFSINVLPDWIQASEEKPNELEFAYVNSSDDTYYDSININMYSRKDGETVGQWVTELLKSLEEDMNPDYYQILKQEDGMINGVNCKKVYYYQKTSGETIYTYDLFVMGENYKYNVFYHVAEKTYQDKEKLAKIEQAINSFQFTEPDAGKVGPLMNPRDGENIKTKVKRQNTKYQWSVELPSTWTADKGNNDKDMIAYSKHLVGFQMLVINGAPLNYVVDSFDENLEKMSKLDNVKVLKKEQINEKGTIVHKYTVLLQTDGLEIRRINYLLSKNGNSYVVSLACPTHSLSAYNEKLLEEVWQSMKFE